MANDLGEISNKQKGYMENNEKNSEKNNEINNEVTYKIINEIKNDTVRNNMVKEGNKNINKKHNESNVNIVGNKKYESDINMKNKSDEEKCKAFFKHEPCLKNVLRNIFLKSKSNKCYDDDNNNDDNNNDDNNNDDNNNDDNNNDDNNSSNNNNDDNNNDDNNSSNNNNDDNNNDDNNSSNNNNDDDFYTCTNTSIDKEINNNNVKNKKQKECINNEEKIPSEVECAICMKLLIVPVTIPCGHNFCRDCIEKAKEYKNLCPLCRSNMGDKKNINLLLGELIKQKYPLTYSKRLEEIENLKLEQEKKVIKERINAINNSSIIPIFKAPLIFGPYFPGEVFDINIYNKRFIDLIYFISNEGTFAITSSKEKNDEKKLYGIHVKILEQKKSNQVFYLKCVANFRVLLYNITLFTDYGNFVGLHSPLFDENISINFLTSHIINNTTVHTDSTNITYGNYNNEQDVGLSNNTNIGGKEKIGDLKKLLYQIEVEEDINLISYYYEQYKNITNMGELIDNNNDNNNNNDDNNNDDNNNNNNNSNNNSNNNNNNNNITNIVKYHCCIILSKICLLCIKNQLNRFGSAGVMLFNTKFRNIKLTSSEPSKEELEKFSYSLSCAIISRSVLKWKWFKITDTYERLESITQYFLKKKNKSILALDNSRSPLIHRFFMLDSISSSLIILVFFLIIICIKYFIY
ncbi:RING zinc finger protein [Plasmodium falciparum NF54]|uniref:RING zinc finger protein, putative n=2 Tax=Plasmodium falciparum TaxID=5833 RepID=Q8IID0_PLAF7|nr:RING zinc finger protein, putative [Plasmodium falciparum 3D7]KAF4331184.1 RING zinc finger protein [Plasmodium falciparum NF54]PKC49287.1 RING zinc finger protein [Plasmodium falciparum NF54]CZT98895.1 RING zinc finger protein, putative [Plasmodium falciparum 3D7]|eukprot:XP_001347915.1 RING zinc finger protein, putative [Plasmodium falciparum 3D7]